MTDITVKGYRNAAINAPLTILAGQTVSQEFSCDMKINASEDVKTSGAFSLRMLTFPATPVAWTPCDVTFQIFQDDTFTNPTILQLPDGEDIVKYSINASIPGISVPLLPFVFDAVVYLKVVCSVLQPVDVDINMVLQPLYQVER